MPYRTDPSDITTRHGAYLPHWTRECVTDAVTFRLADSLPQAVLAAWVHEREEIEAVAASLPRLPVPLFVLRFVDFTPVFQYPTL